VRKLFYINVLTAAQCVATLLPVQAAMAGESTMKSHERGVFAEFVSPGDSLSALRYLDTEQVSINDRCPILKGRLNPKMAPAYVNGRPVGFC